jgi:vitamin K-dependent gamma-carboxylase-like protein
MATEARTSALPLALFRVGFGACLAWDIASLMNAAPLWFAGLSLPVVPLLVVWLVAALGLMLGAFTGPCAWVNYLFCVVMLGFVGLERGFEYHLDNLYILASFGLLFLPVSRVLSIDARRSPPEDRTVGRLPFVFLALVVSGIYLDSAIWKLSSRMWIEGLGYWAPASQPWDGRVALNWTLEHEWIARAAGYITLVYELLFVVLVWSRRLRLPLLTVGFLLHLGIGLVLPLPRFGTLMVVFLIGLLPLGKVTQVPARPPSPWRVPIVAGFIGWALAFCLVLVEPVGVLVRHGLGGVDGALPRSWHVTDNTTAARLAQRAMSWSYRLFGVRSHPIFLDSQFVDATVETRLLTRDGERLARLHEPLVHRHWLAWNYRIAWPLLPLERAEAQLLRFVDYHATRRGLDLERVQVIVEQRPIEMPVDGWRKGQRARNLASVWRQVGVIEGPTGALSATWQDPVWTPRRP